MLNRLTRPALLGLLGLCLMAAGPARALDEGIDYQTLAMPQPTETGNKVEVLEFFWYGCPHCYQLEPGLEKWNATKPANVEFRRVPAILGPSWEPGARAYFAMEQLGVLERLHKPLLRAIHEEKKRLADANNYADWMAAQGVDRDEFMKAYNSFTVDMKVRKVQQMPTKYGIDGVPVLVVNGKYRASQSIAGSTERLFKVLDTLVAQESGTAPAPDPATAK